MAENEEKKQNKSNVGQKVGKKVQDKLSKSMKGNAAKKALLKLLMPILTWVIVGIVALIIIIGIVLFFITMPGMVMDKLKAIAKIVGNALAAWFGADTTKQVENTRIYEALDYLEEMGYDIKGYGFLTDYVSSADDIDKDAKKDNGVNLDEEMGVIRDEDDKIITAKSDFLFSYLASDNYVYTIANFNTKDTGWLARLGQHLLSLITAGQSNAFWSHGMIEIRHDDGFLGNEGSMYSVYDLGSITIDAEEQTMEIKRGWFNNSMKYNLQGWTGRYGMPLDFLISVHIATMMPDLAYDMATTFETEVKLLLHAVNEGTAVGYYKAGDKYISYDQMEELADDSWVPGDGWFINAKEAKRIMDTYHIPSPDNCIGVGDLGSEDMDSGSNFVYITEKFDNKFYNINESENGFDSSQLTEIKNEKQTIVDTYNEMIEKIKGYGGSDDVVEKIASADKLDEFLKDNGKEETRKNSTEYGCTVTYTNGKSLYRYTKECGFEGNFASNDEERKSNTAYNTEKCYYEVEIKMIYIPGFEQSADGSTFDTNPQYKIEYTITRIWSQAEIQDYIDKYNEENPDHKITTINGLKCSENTESDTCCKICKKYIQSIYDKVCDVDVSDMESYQPYIARVINHWYRDVYFVTADENKEFVDYDYNYEAITKERWTLYETDSDGEFKLYKANEDGTIGELYSGTKEDAEKEGIKVTKKAKTIKIGDKASDLSWQKLWNRYSAYTFNENSQEVFQQVEFDDPDEIDKHIYAGIITKGNIVQSGEGQRTETNTIIKNMFLNNTYFRYDGSKDTAEIITALRKNNEIEYGCLSDDQLALTAEVDGKTYKVSDYSGQVSLNQDSLNAFSMLENEHTLDADYIYRDFKELIVELGYFEKQELTDETPRLLEFLVPEIGSFNYPYRILDKNENEYGTMIHSKGDIDIPKEQLIAEILKQEAELGVNGDESNVQKKESTPDENTPETKVSNSPDLQTVSGIDNIDVVDSQIDLTNSVGSTKEVEDCPDMQEKGYITKSIWDGVEYLDYKQGMGYYASNTVGGKTMSGAGCGPTSAAVIASAYGKTKDPYEFAQATGMPAPWEGIKSELEKLDIPGEIHTEEEGVEGLTKTCRDAFSEGKPIIVLVGFSANQGSEVQYTASGGHYFVMLGVDASGVLQFSNVGTVEEAKNQYVAIGGGDALTEFIDKYVVNSPSASGAVWIPDEAPDGHKSAGEEYKGYEGNEGVVSPVTGILLEYGTYEEGDDYRVNTDLKYGFNILGQSTDNGEETSDPDQPAEPTPDDGVGEGEEVKDKVGYAKILVLDKEYYKILESKMLSEAGWTSTFAKEKGYRDLDSLDKDSIKEWSDARKTLYGYKEFAENYETAGIAGYIVYIDGFNPQKIDEDFDVKKKDTENPAETEAIDFKSFTLSSFDSDGNVDNEDDVLDSLYEKEEEYKMASKRATAKLNAEAEIKNDAISSMYFDSIDSNNTYELSDLIVLKEGTVIGRTYTDRELITVVRGKDESEFLEYRPESTTSDTTGKLVGNYIRIIFRDLDGTVVENVEDYMKLDDGEIDKSQTDYFSVVNTVLSKQEWVEKTIAYVNANHSGADDIFKSEDAMTEFFEICVEEEPDGTMNPEYGFVKAIQEEGLHATNGNYWGYNVPNGAGATAAEPWQNVLRKFRDTIAGYRDPATDHYRMIEERNRQREICADWGGVPEHGFGPQWSAEGVQTIYSWLGDDHNANSAGAGGMYYLYPWGWGGDQYEGENKIIFESKAQFEERCGRPHGTSGGATSSTPTTVWEQGAYTDYQVRMIIDLATKAYGEVAGTYAGEN